MSPWSGITQFTTASSNARHSDFTSDEAEPPSPTLLPFSFNLLPLKIIPNPAKESTTIYWESTDQANLKIWSSTGKLIESVKLITDHRTLNTEHWPAGIYFIELKHETGVLRKKLIVQ